MTSNSDMPVMLNKWVSVSDDMPPCDQIVLTWDGYTIGLDFCDVEVDFGTVYFANLTHTTHWALIDTEESLLAELEKGND